jgi:hypothetical protein
MKVMTGKDTRWISDAMWCVRHFAMFFLALGAYCQTPVINANAIATEPSTVGGSRRIAGLIPNFRTEPVPARYEPLTARAKFRIAANDAFDRGTISLAGIFAAQGQLAHSNESFGQGAGAYAHYLGTSYADFMTGNLLTEGVFPALLHQDPRYFRKGSGAGRSRFGHAAKQIFWTEHDSGKGEFNYSEIGGNSAAVAISMAYYPDSRRASNATSMLGLQVGLDMASNVLKEFWPDIEKKLSRRRRHDRL